MKSVIDDSLSANRAFDLPLSTLKDHLSRRVIHGTKPGPKPYLTVDEEAELSQHLLQASAMGLGKTRRDVKCLVEVCVSLEAEILVAETSEMEVEMEILKPEVLETETLEVEAETSKTETLDAETLEMET